MLGSLLERRRMKKAIKDVRYIISQILSFRDIPYLWVSDTVFKVLDVEVEFKLEDDGLVFNVEGKTFKVNNPFGFFGVDAEIEYMISEVFKRKYWGKIKDTLDSLGIIYREEMINVKLKEYSIYCVVTGHNSNYKIILRFEFENYEEIEFKSLKLESNTIKNGDRRMNNIVAVWNTLVWTDDVLG